MYEILNVKTPEISHKSLLSQEVHPNDRSLCPYIRQTLKYLAIHKLVVKLNKFIKKIHVTIRHLKTQSLTHSINQSINRSCI